jgi:SAM-dependent methyltransferase
MPPSTATDVACSSCGARGARVFHRADRVPVHSCLLMPTRNEAVDYPRGDLRIAFCPSCGFIQNSAFDPGVHEYSPRYEETQAFSARFMAFARELASDYVGRYAPKTVLEIGCGKGEFLVLTCEIGGCKGIGIDPGYRPERTDSPARDRLEFIVDFYSERYAHLEADLVLCRHTLEHIQPVREFVGMVRRAVGDRPEVAVCFELPDTERILAEQGFWDIYYEHCSYFTLGSLCRLFQAAGFRVTRLDKTFEGQYLLIDGHPCAGRDARAVPGADDLARTAALVAAFERELPRKLDEWRAFFANVKARRERAVLWGSGSKAVAFLTTLGIGDEVACVTDINPFRHGMFMPGTGHEIVPPAELRNVRPDVVVAMNPIYRDEIRADLAKLGLRPELRAV